MCVCVKNQRELNLSGIPKHKPIKNNPKTRKHSLCNKQGPAKKCRLNSVIDFVEQTMTTLSKHSEQLETQLDFNLTKQSMLLT